MREFYEKYKVWMPWHCLPIAIFLAIMYTAGAVFYLRDRIVRGLEARQEAQAARGREVPAVEAATPGTVAIEARRASPIQVQVFRRRLAASPEGIEAREEAEKEFEETRVKGMTGL